jgi:hypothetical protein
LFKLRLAAVMQLLLHLDYQEVYKRKARNHSHCIRGNASLQSYIDFEFGGGNAIADASHSDTLVCQLYCSLPILLVVSIAHAEGLRKHGYMLCSHHGPWYKTSKIPVSRLGHPLTHRLHHTLHSRSLVRTSVFRYDIVVACSVTSFPYMRSNSVNLDNTS